MLSETVKDTVPPLGASGLTQSKFLKSAGYFRLVDEREGVVANLPLRVGGGRT